MWRWCDSAADDDDDKDDEDDEEEEEDIDMKAGCAGDASGDGLGGKEEATEWVRDEEGDEGRENWGDEKDDGDDPPDQDGEIPIPVAAEASDDDGDGDPGGSGAYNDVTCSNKRVSFTYELVNTAVEAEDDDDAADAEGAAAPSLAVESCRCCK